MKEKKKMIESHDFVTSPPPKKNVHPQNIFQDKVILKKKRFKKIRPKIKKEPVTTCSSKLNTLLLLPE